MTRTLAIAAALLISTAAHAEFKNTPPPNPDGQYECSIVNQNPWPRRDDDPVYKINVNLNLAEGDGHVVSMGVWHTVRSGRSYDRSAQYQNAKLWQTPGKMEWNWTGYRGSNTQMVGMLYHNDRDGWMYRELIVEQGRPIYTMLADCHSTTEGD